MIENDEQLDATVQALGHLYRALSSLRQTVLPINPRQFALFAEGPLDEIRKLQDEIDDYLGISRHDTAPAETVFGETPPPYGNLEK